MPFHDGVYYPYSSDTQGTHSSAGIPSLLNSPLSQHSANGHAAPGMTPSSGAPAAAALPFKFRPRRESVDWRRINAVDIDLVVSQLDVDALQEYISTVTFCSLDGERCQRCQSPVDPALVKLFQLAQLTVEWVLHCQEFLTLNLRVAEERLAAGDRDRKQLLAQLKGQEDKVQALTAELKQRKKIIRTQQSMLMPQIIVGHKCSQCDKSFLNASFLQSHMQRRHPDEYKNQLRSDNEEKSHIDSLKSEIISLKEQIAQQQQDLQTKVAQEKELQSMHKKDLQREIDHFKAEEMARMDRKIEDSRDSIRREMEFLYTRNIQALNEANQNQTAKHEKSAVQSQPERDLDNYKEMHLQAIQKLEHQMKRQDEKWKSRLQDIKAQHESEKNQLLNELSRTHASVSDHQERWRRLQQETARRLQENEQTIEAQREQLRSISSTPTPKVVEIPVLVSAAAPEPKPKEPKPKRVVLEEPVCASKLDPIQELSEEEKDSSSFSERRPPDPEKKPRVTPGVTKSMKKDMRPVVKEDFERRVEDLGVKPDQTGLTKEEFASVRAKLQSRRAGYAKGAPDYWRLRDELAGAAEQRLRGRRGSDPAPEPLARSRQSVQVLQRRPRSSSVPSRATQVMSGAAVKQPKTPQPAPRTRTVVQPKTSTPSAKTAMRSSSPKTPPFSSSEEEDSDMEEEQPPKHQKAKSPQSRLNQGNPVQIKASISRPVLARQAPARDPFSSGAQQQQTRAPPPATKTAVMKMESDEEDEEWSEVSELQEIDPRQLQGHRDQNGNVEKRSFESKVTDLARKMEKQVAGRATRKPAGGVSVLPERKDEVQELTYTDLEESSEWGVSSLEDKQEMSKPAHGSGLLRKSLDSPSTSVWGTSTGKGPKSGLTGTGSTLKSSLCSLSDISDSDDLSNKQ